MTKPLNIQIFGSPGTGKSTLASGLFYNMKVQGYKVEFISEYAKGLTYSQDYTKLKDQLMVLANQYHKFYRTKNSEIDYLIHESPFLLGLVYFQEDDIIKEQYFKPLIVNMYKNMNSINIFLERNIDLGYQEFGRNQKLEEAIELDNKILKILDENEIPYIKLKSSDKTIEEILEIIKNNKQIDLHKNVYKTIKLGNITNKLNDANFIKHCEELANLYKSNGRKYEDILEHTLCGEAIEDLVCEIFGLNKTKFETSEYDAEKDGLKYEIKHTISQSEWWVYNPDAYKFFIQNSDKLDYIILVYLDESTKDVYLKYVAKAKNFKDYTRKSSYNSKYIYDVRKAEANSDVRIYNTL